MSILVQNYSIESSDFHRIKFEETKFWKNPPELRSEEISRKDSNQHGNLSEISFLRIPPEFVEPIPSESWRIGIHHRFCRELQDTKGNSSERSSGGFRRDWFDRHLPNPGDSLEFVRYTSPKSRRSLVSSDPVRSIR